MSSGPASSCGHAVRSLRVAPPVQVVIGMRCHDNVRRSRLCLIRVGSSLQSEALICPVPISDLQLDTAVGAEHRACRPSQVRPLSRTEIVFQSGVIVDRVPCQLAGYLVLVLVVERRAQGLRRAVPGSPCPEVKVVLGFRAHRVARHPPFLPSADVVSLHQ
eukprot:1047681-Rhodomonas_salina.1